MQFNDRIPRFLTHATVPASWFPIVTAGILGSMNTLLTSERQRHEEESPDGHVIILSPSTGKIMKVIRRPRQPGMPVGRMTGLAGGATGDCESRKQSREDQKDFGG